MSEQVLADRPRRLLVLTGLVLLFGASLGGLYRASSSDGYGVPASELCGDYVKDMGEVEAGSVAEHSFELSCQGQHPIVITRIQTSCSCLAVVDNDFIGKTLSPGESVICRLGMQIPPVLKNHSAKAVVEYRSNGYVRSRVLTLMASVVADYALSVSDIDLGELSDVQSEREFSVELIQLGKSEKSVDIKQVICELAEVAVSLDSSTQFTIKYGHRDFDRATKINVPIIVETTSDVLPRSVIQLNGSFQPAITIEPDSVFIGSIERRESFVVPIRVRTTRNASVNVDASECNFCEVLMNDSAEPALENLVEVKLTPPSAAADAILTLTIGYEDGRKYMKRVSIVRF